jgi:predicted Rossmann-fold nucleotide-binding protein
MSVTTTTDLAGRAAAERRLAAVVRSGPGLRVLTGGQTGVDTYGARAALAAGLPVHLVFPAGYRQEDGPLTPSRRRRIPGAVLHELDSASFRHRTWTCAYLADVIVLLDPAGGSGCQETARAARTLGRPLLRPRPGQLTAEGFADWLAGASAHVLMVAGCRASLLASAGKDRSVRADVAAVVAGATLWSEALRCAGERIDPS